MINRVLGSELEKQARTVRLTTSYALESLAAVAEPA